MMDDRLIENVGSRLGEEVSTRTRSAISFARQKHAGQSRASGEEYVTHPIAVAEILDQWHLDADTIIAGVLHDTVEDTDTTLDEIETRFGPQVRLLVDGVTKVSKTRTDMKPLDQYGARTRENLSKLIIATARDIRVLFIKLADRLHNMRTLQYLAQEKQQKIARETISVFAPLADRIGMGMVRVQLEELSFSYLEPIEFKRLQHIVKTRIRRAQRAFEPIQREVSRILLSQHIEFAIDGRIKSLYSLYKKLRKAQDMDAVYDLLAHRIIVETSEDCYRVLGVLHSLYRPIPTKIKDYIASPKTNGYQSLHTTVITPQKTVVEFQIRSREMHEYAEHGLAAAFYYNEQKTSGEYLRSGSMELPQHLRWIAELQEAARRLVKGAEAEDITIDLFSDRIFVYSPKGDIYDLPEGAFPLDFAFAVHSDVGKHAHGAKVNGVIAPLSHTLASGDVVEIIAVKNAHPTTHWLEITKTPRAKQAIRAYLKQHR